MLQIISKMQDLPFRELTQVYEQSLQQAAARDYPGKDDGLLQAELDMYAYLKDTFFRIDGARYFIWEEDGHMLCALRLEPYKDGLLLTALETHPDYRNMGYAGRLMEEVLHEVHGCIYSHIDRHNIASIVVHRKHGFEKITNFAVYLDGSVSRKADTYCRKFVKS